MSVAGCSTAARLPCRVGFRLEGDGRSVMLMMLRQSFRFHTAFTSSARYSLGGDILAGPRCVNVNLFHTVGNDLTGK